MGEIGARLREMVSRWWWRIWTGHDDLSSVRRRLEQDVMRFGGHVTWDQENR